MKVSICIITLGRESLYKTLDSLLSQDFEHEFEIIILSQGNFDISRVKDKTKIGCVHTFFCEKGLGFSYYRNSAFLNSRGEIIVFTDDDTWTQDNSWLSNLLTPIISGEYSVSTSGLFVQLQQGYWSDCISLLGYPGGAALGFEKVWLVDQENTCTNVCGGNFAITRELFLKIGSFDERMKGSCDDTQLSLKIVQNNDKIKYCKNATLFHAARNLSSFDAWCRTRVNGAKTLKTVGGLNDKNIYRNKIHHLKSIFLAMFWHPFKSLGMIYLFFRIFMIARGYR